MGGRSPSCCPRSGSPAASWFLHRGRDLPACWSTPASTTGPAFNLSILHSPSKPGVRRRSFHSKYYIRFSTNSASRKSGSSCTVGCSVRPTSHPRFLWHWLPLPFEALQVQHRAVPARAPCYPHQSAQGSRCGASPSRHHLRPLQGSPIQQRHLQWRS